MDYKGFSVSELDGQHAAELPRRDLLIGVSVLGIPLAGVSDVSVNVDTRARTGSLGPSAPSSGVSLDMRATPADEAGVAAVAEHGSWLTGKSWLA